MSRKIALFILVFQVSTLFLHAKVWMPKKTSQIQENIDAAAPFDTIIIEGIHCFENPVLVNKPLVIKSEYYAGLDFQSNSGGIIINSDSVSVYNLEISNIKKSSINDYAAIHAEGVSNVLISNNRVFNAFFGIYFADCTKSSIVNNLVDGFSTIEQKTGNAVHLWQCDSMLIEKNRVTNHRDGVYLEFVTNTLVNENISKNNIRYGLHFMFSHNDTYKNNWFLNNSAGVAVMYSKNVRMISNQFKDNWGDCSYGLLLKDITDGALINNTFQRNTIALLMEGTNRLDINDNEFSNNGWAVKIAANCEGNIVSKNSFYGNSFDVSTNGHTVMNKFDGNYWDNYEGYDLNRDGIGDIPYHPVSLFSVMVERVPESLMLYRSFLTFLLDKSEHAMPSITPSDLVDNEPRMKSQTQTQVYAVNK
ncbi:MAG: nitrous oxide reductase family maturation protein NosD [Bacteroidia bacterium]